MSASLSHHECVPLLDAYLDRELDERTEAAVAGHVADCAHCTRVLELHRRLRARLGEIPAPPHVADLHARIMADIDDQQPRKPERPRLFAWGGWALAAGLALAWLFTFFAPAPTTPIPMVQAAVRDFSAHTTQAWSPPDLAAVQARVPFPVSPLATPGARLLATWSTTLRDEPAAALAYRVGSHIVVQYIVSERLFFEQASVRQAIAREGHYSAQDGRVQVFGWARPQSGVLLVGDVDLPLLAALKM